MDDLLASIEEVDGAVKDGIAGFGLFVKAFYVAANALEHISTNADGPEDCARAKEAIDAIKHLLKVG